PEGCRFKSCPRYKRNPDGLTRALKAGLTIGIFVMVECHIADRRRDRDVVGWLSTEPPALIGGPMKPRMVDRTGLLREVNAGQKLVIVGLWTPWCRPCKFMHRVLEAISGEFPEEVSILTIDLQQFPEVAKDFNVQSIPTILFFWGGQAVERVVGISTTAFLRNYVRRLMGQLNRAV
ncbi:MAG: thioredoxin family protein, partial [Bacteroidota bacterium]